MSLMSITPRLLAQDNFRCISVGFFISNYYLFLRETVGAKRDQVGGATFQIYWAKVFLLIYLGYLSKYCENPMAHQSLFLTLFFYRFVLLFTCNPT